MTRQYGNEKIIESMARTIKNDAEEIKRLRDLNKKIEKENNILFQALRVACKTLNVVCLTQDYMLGLGLNEQWFIKKAKENLKK